MFRGAMQWLRSAVESSRCLLQGAAGCRCLSSPCRRWSAALTDVISWLPQYTYQKCLHYAQQGCVSFCFDCLGPLFSCCERFFWPWGYKNKSWMWNFAIEKPSQTITYLHFNKMTSISMYSWFTNGGRLHHFPSNLLRSADKPILRICGFPLWSDLILRQPLKQQGL